MLLFIFMLLLFLLSTWPATGWSANRTWDSVRMLRTQAMSLAKPIEALSCPSPPCTHAYTIYICIPLVPPWRRYSRPIDRVLSFRATPISFVGASLNLLCGCSCRLLIYFYLFLLMLCPSTPTPPSPSLLCYSFVSEIISNWNKSKSNSKNVAGENENKMKRKWKREK